MATSYWDPYSTTTGSYPNIHSSTATSSNWNFYVPVVIHRRILVQAPENWTDEQNIKFVELVNIHTKTGWKISLVIKGDILITDANIERRSMADFIPLLKQSAANSDIDMINQFFKDNPL